jgi:NAD(P)-dependent dehydrogenase (short-subunit alcohol dehydrogenase family)
VTADITEGEWGRIITIHLRSVFLCLKYEIALMLQDGGGAIVNTSSALGHPSDWFLGGMVARSLLR